MNKSSLVLVAIAVFWTLPLSAQDMTIGDLKAKGGKALSAEELRALLPGKVAHYETIEYTYQQKFEPDGSVAGSWQRTIGGKQTVQFRGDWSVSDDGRWCGVQRSYRSNEIAARYCRDIYKLDDKYFYSAGAKNNDARPALPINFSN